MLRRYFLTPIPMALAAILQFPLRAALTAFGILIGVAAVVVTIALGEGAERAVQRRLSQLGDNSLTIRAERAQQSGAAAELRRPRLSESDGEAIAREAPSVARVAPVLSSRHDIVFGGFDVSTEIIGTTREFLPIRAWKLDRGELWSGQAELTAQRVCVIGQKIRQELFEGLDPIGRVMRIGRHPFRILGVLEEKGQGQFGRDQDDVVLTPIATQRAKLQPGLYDEVDQLLLSATAAETTNDAEVQATAILRERHGLAEEAESDFRIRSQASFRETQDRVVGILRLLLTSIAAISLVVGGIGIMNIMLVSVSERTRDIGVRMAIGATRLDILTQFLAESVVLSALGGGLGAALAIAMTELLSGSLNIPMEASPSALLLAISVSVGIGVVFGLLPARRAASLDPIQALGRE